MSPNRNVDSLSNQGEFHSRVPPSKPLTTKGVSHISTWSTEVQLTLNSMHQAWKWAMKPLLNLMLKLCPQEQLLQIEHSRPKPKMKSPVNPWTLISPKTHGLQPKTPLKERLVRMYTPDMVIQAAAKLAKNYMVMGTSPGRERKRVWLVLVPIDQTYSKNEDKILASSPERRGRLV